MKLYGSYIISKLRFWAAPNAVKCWIELNLRHCSIVWGSISRVLWLTTLIKQNNQGLFTIYQLRLWERRTASPRFKRGVAINSGSILSESETGPAQGGNTSFRKQRVTLAWVALVSRHVAPEWQTFLTDTGSKLRMFANLWLNDLKQIAAAASYCRQVTIQDKESKKSMIDSIFVLLVLLILYF